jgi:hypothetical protein
MNDDDSFIPLLSKKPLCLFTPEEFKAYVRGLFFKRPPKKTTAKKKKRLRDLKVTVRRLKSGKITVRTKRDPKYVTSEEYAALTKLHLENELFIALRSAEVNIYETHELAEQIRRDVEEIPW